jgi:hypothetical protein
MNNTI